MLRQENDLSDVLGVVGNLAIDGLQYRVRFAANRDCTHDVFGLERIDCPENAGPAFFPPCHHFAAGRGGAYFEFPVAEAVGLLSIAGEKVGEAGAHIASQMLDKNGNGVRLGIERGEEVFVSKLAHRAFAHALVSAQLVARFLEVVSRRISHINTPPGSNVRIIHATSIGFYERRLFAEAAILSYSPAAAARGFDPNTLALAYPGAE